MIASTTPAVAVTGYGVVTPHGLGIDPLWSNLLKRQTCIANDTGTGIIDQDILEQLKYSLPKDDGESASCGREKSLLMALYAIQQSMLHAGWTSLNSDDGLIFATTTGYIASWENELLGFLSGSRREDSFQEAFRREPLGTMLADICNGLNFCGHNLLITTACSSSAQAIAIASDWIRLGKVKRCLVGGCETLSMLTSQGFDCFKLLTRELARPFDKKRSGINLAEGAAFICLENESTIVDRQRIQARILGGGIASDAYHMTAPHPEGLGIYNAMKIALNDASIDKSEIDFIHAHGTGSYHNDLSEGLAIQRLFGEHSPPVYSTKPIHGHTLAACGVIESIICIKTLTEQILPTNIGLKDRDEKLKINLPLEHESVALKKPIKFILKSSLGFGGSNAAIVLGGIS
ncbi:MAG: beta-ketoacyl-[acyl-carrier-protein] synthase family protein [Oligoflexia bacterium]|nr:beta-ketoacyl-[acyl-carrier-protein] synthase family protein [Oligoflexia bacterium]